MVCYSISKNFQGEETTLPVVYFRKSKAIKAKQSFDLADRVAVFTIHQMNIVL